MMQEVLKGKVAIVTGGTSGIGRAIAIKFAEQGAKVAIIGTNKERGEEILKLVGKESAFYPTDVSQFAQVQQTIKQILQHFGTIDILVNNAGVTKDQLLIKMSEDDWDVVLDVNLKSCYNLTHACVRQLMRNRSGKIINVTSVVGLVGNAGQANYAASKAGIIGFTKALAAELAARNINVNAIAPGFIESKMTDALSEPQKEITLAQIPFGKMGKPDDVANAALFLASDYASYITGITLAVDGGMVMH